MISIESFFLEKPLYSRWYKETMFCNYCRSISKALLNKELFHCRLSRILTIAFELLVCGRPSKVMNHVHHVSPFWWSTFSLKLESKVKLQHNKKNLFGFEQLYFYEVTLQYSCKKRSKPVVQKSEINI